MNFYNDNSRKISKLQKMLIIVSFIIIIIWGIYFVIHLIYTIGNNNTISNYFIYYCYLFLLNHRYFNIRSFLQIIFDYTGITIEKMNSLLEV